MTDTLTEHTDRTDDLSGARIARRLRPLRIVMLLEGVAFWVPVEKLFMTQLGFDTGKIAAMAAAYAAVVPVLEIPSGILADRWSRRGVLLLAELAAMLSVVVGALAHNVPTYVVSAMLLGVYFAMQSGTVDTIVYDLLLQETGSDAGYERHLGRLQLGNSLALAASALAGGLIASAASPRWCYLATIPLALITIPVLLRFREPTLHRTAARTTLRHQLTQTYRTVAHQPGLLVVLGAAAIGAMTLQLVFEFGPLWLFAAGAPTLILGPYTAAMTSALGLGGLLAGRSPLRTPAGAVAAAVAMIVCAATLALSHNTFVLVGAQIVLALLLVAAGIHLSRILHQRTPSAVRSAISSTAGTLSWLTFLPASLVFGFVSTRAGISAAGWVPTVLVAVLAIGLVRISRRRS